MATKTPQSVADKWKRRLQAATQDVTDGVNAVRVNPAEQAVQKQAKLLANFTAAVNSGKWAAGLQRTTLQSWQQAMIQKGVPRIAQGAEAGMPKMQAFMQQLLPYQDTLSQQVANMSDLSLEDSIARMTAWTRGMANFKRS
jgi:hypothetical protein